MDEDWALAAAGREVWVTGSVTVLLVLVACAVEGTDAPFWAPAVAGPVGLGVAGSESWWSICLAVTLTSLGTGYVLGIDPRWA